MKRLLVTASLLLICAAGPAMAQDATGSPFGNTPDTALNQPEPEYQTPAPVPASPVYTPSAQPIVIPTEAPKRVYTPRISLPAGGVKLELPPEVAKMVKDYDQAVARLKPEEKKYIDGIVFEGHKLDDPLHDLMVKSMDWQICVDNGLADAKAQSLFDRYHQREEQIYKENMFAYENGVIANIKSVEPQIVKNKITAQGIISMTTMKQLYAIEESKATSDKIQYDCEMLNKFVKNYNAQNTF